MDLGVSLHKIANYYNLNKFQTKLLIKKWYAKSKFSGNFEDYYNSILTNINNNPLTTTELYKTFNDISINYSNYNNLKQNYYIKRFVYNKLMYNALEHIK